MKIDNAINNYLINRGSRLSPNSVERYARSLHKLSKWTGNVELDSITDTMLDNYFYQLKDTLSAKTRSLDVSAIRGFFKFYSAKKESIVTWELIQAPRVPEKQMAFISEEKFELIDECLDEDEYGQLERKVVFQMLWNTGMRISELLSLNINDIHTQKNYAHVVTAKTGKMRMVMWNDECHRLLIKYLGIRICLNKQPELFQTPPSARGMKHKSRLTSRSVQRWCKQLEEFLGFRIHPHAFRHGKCHHILNNGGNRSHIQRIAGHSTITSSEVYTRLNVHEQTQVMQQFLPKQKARQKMPMIDNAWRSAA